MLNAGVVLEWVEDDGGRASAGFKGSAGDCVVRSIAIASGRSYREVYETLSVGARQQRRSKRCKRRQVSARDGVHTSRKWFKKYMVAMGFQWTPTMGIGTGCQVHLADGELPMGRLVVSISRHYTAVIDGIIHDTYDCSRGGKRCVYGYWQLKTD